MHATYLVIGLIIGGLSSGIILTTMITLVIRDKQIKAMKESETTLVSTIDTTTTAVLKVPIYWTFDNNLQDLYNNFNGIGNNGPTYKSSTYNRIGTCLQLNQSSVTVNNPPLLNLANISFTFEMWLYGDSFYYNSSYTDNYILDQFDQNVTDRFFHLIIRNQRVQFGFGNDDLTSSQTLIANRWYHLAVVYDYSTRSQTIYINGYLDVSRSGAGPYLGSSGDFTIGTGVINSPNNYFSGCLDSVQYYPWIRNTSIILSDATLVAHLTFDSGTLVDSGPLSINGTGLNYTYTSMGRVNQAISFPVLSSYVQITGLTRLGTNAWPYTVSIWIYPTNSSGGTIMHLSSRVDGAQTNAWCLPIMGLTSSGQIAINSWNATNVPITGPSVSLFSWTHVVATYSLKNGERLYVNGSQYGSSSVSFAFQAGSIPMTLTIGSSLLGLGVCNTGTIQMGQFYGSVDELQVYARELSSSEVFALANP
ncbi:unnamed protein product [Adineta ricciae]|uniref:LamG-like jellyroll fold domain-containing protein n=1 Tax=Adineta ricciae TaxID=249248 RepID=A0A815SUB7_ADIRI|nr:unnamed protein product [Adineta ricciae]CAF1494564.1 unnamed protein product [Adineta ricciae]